MNDLINKIHFADCLDVLKQLPDGSVDLFLQDPPYNTTACEWEYKLDFEPLWKEWLRVGKKDAAFIFTAAQPFATDLIQSCRKWFRYDLIWEKSHGIGFLDAKKKPLKSHELILLFYQKMPTYNPQMRPVFKKVSGTRAHSKSRTKIYGEHSKVVEGWTDNGLRFPTSVIQFDLDGERYNSTIVKDLHPTKKPVDLFRYLIKTYSNENEVIFDGYGGSGTTAIAAVMERRKFIVCENCKPYFEASTNRLANLVAQPTLF